MLDSNKYFFTFDLDFTNELFYRLSQTFSLMGFFYRKSVNFGPFRVNLSKSGLGYSVGGRGFRVGKSARGRSYSAFHIPGTGVGYRGKGCLGLVVLLPAASAAIACAYQLIDHLI